MPSLSLAPVGHLQTNGRTARLQQTGLACAQRVVKVLGYLKDVLDAFSDGHMVGARLRFTGTQQGSLGPFPPTGRRMTVEYIAIDRIEDGWIAEAWAEWDHLTR